MNDEKFFRTLLVIQIGAKDGISRFRFLGVGGDGEHAGGLVHDQDAVVLEDNFKSLNLHRAIVTQSGTLTEFVRGRLNSVNVTETPDDYGMLRAAISVGLHL